MTKVTLDYDKNRRTLSCNAKGHADFAVAGNDIVCSAVTVLLRTAIQVLSSMDGIKFESEAVERGTLSFCAEVSEAGSESEIRLECIRNFLETGLSSISVEYPDNVCFCKHLED
jgi:uncharacterized protein YsxB (DUF464 family)